MYKIKPFENFMKQYLSVATILGLAALPVQADVYDVLRGTTPSQNLSYSDVSSIASAGVASAVEAETAAQDPNQPPPPPPTTMREEAFKELLHKTFPLKPEQIVEIHRQLDRSQLAVHTDPNNPPQPTSSTLNVDLSPGAASPIVRLATGFVTSIMFLDSTGKPWPVMDYSLGNPTGFNIKWDSKTNALFIQSTKAHITGNMAVRLANLDTPIMISLVTGQRDVDYRLDLIVPGSGPNAEAAVVDTTLPQGAAPSLLSALDGVPPVGSIELCIPKEYGRVWVYNGKLLFRTKLTLLSPAWSGSVSSPDGTRVYELMQTPLILASLNGKTIKIELAGL
jgi:intracellular multiplication protein IcmK